MADIVLERDAGVVSTRTEIFDDAQGVTAVMLWQRISANPDDFKKVRDVKKSADAEGAPYDVGDPAELDGLFLEWFWTAVRAPESTAASGTIRLFVEQGGAQVSGFPLDFDFALGDGMSPISYSLTRRITVVR